MVLACELVTSEVLGLRDFGFGGLLKEGFLENPRYIRGVQRVMSSLLRTVWDSNKEKFASGGEF